jgi:hypothetical protein
VLLSHSSLRDLEHTKIKNDDDGNERRKERIKRDELSALGTLVPLARQQNLN